MRRVLLVLFFFSFSVSMGYANFGDTYGWGAKGIGMGNAVTATVDDWTSPFYNISGLGKKPKKRKLEEAKTKITLIYKTLAGKRRKKTIAEKGVGGTDANVINNNELGFCYFYTAPKMKVSYDGAEEVDNLGFGAIALGLVIDMNTFLRMPWDLNARLGLIFGIQQDMGLGKTTDDDPRTHYFLRYGRRIQRFITSFGAGIEVWKNHLYIGAGVTVFAGGQGVVEINKVGITEEEQTPPTRSKLDLNPKTAPVYGMSFKWENLGPGHISFGAAYRGEIYMAIDPFDTQATTDLADIEMRMSISIMDFYTPPIYVAGLAYTYIDLWIFREYTIEFDVEYQQWSKFFLSDLHKAQTYYEDPNFNDIYIYKVGMEQMVLSWLKVRQGYIYQPAFTPDQTGKNNFLDNDKHILSFGLGFIIPDVIVLKVPVEVDLAYQYQYLVERESKKVDTTNVYNPTYTYSGNVHTGFLSIRWRY